MSDEFLAVKESLPTVSLPLLPLPQSRRVIEVNDAQALQSSDDTSTTLATRGRSGFLDTDARREAGANVQLSCGRPC